MTCLELYQSMTIHHDLHSYMIHVRKVMFSTIYLLVDKKVSFKEGKLP